MRLIRFPSLCLIVLSLCSLHFVTKIHSSETVTPAERFEKILQRNPRRGTALEQVLRHHRERETLVTYFETTRRAAQSDPADAKAWLLLGLLAESLDKPEEAVSAYRKALQTDADNPLPPLYLGQALLALQKNDDAGKTLELALNIATKKKGSLTSEEAYDLLLALGKTDAKTENLQRSFDAIPRLFPEPLQTQLRFLKDLSSRETAAWTLSCYDKLSRFPDLKETDRSRITLAKCDFAMLCNNNPAEIETLLQNAIATRPGDASLRLKLVEILKSQNKFTEVASEYEALSRLSPDVWQYPLQRGFAVFSDSAREKSDRKQTSRHIWRTLVQSHAGNLELLAAVGEAFAASGMPEDAESCFRNALEICPEKSPYRPFLEESTSEAGLIRIYTNENAAPQSTADFFVNAYRKNRETAMNKEFLDRIFDAETISGILAVERLQETLVRMKTETQLRSGDFAILESRLKNATSSVSYQLELLRQAIDEERFEQAETLIAKLETSQFPDPQTMLRFSSSLERLGKNEASFRWKRKAIFLDPALFFADPIRYVKEYEKRERVPVLLEDLCTLDSSHLFKQPRELAAIIERMLRDRDHRTQGLRLLEHLWNRRDISPDTRFEFRYAILKGLVWFTDSELQPYFKELVFEMISADDDFQTRSGVKTNPHHVLAWSSDACRSFSLVLIACTENVSLSELKNEIHAVVREHEAVPAAQRKWSAYAYAVVLDALLELKLGRPNSALASLKRLERNENTTAYLTDAAAVLGQEFAPLDETPYRSFAISCFEKALKINRESYGEVYLNLQLMQLKSK